MLLSKLIFVILNAHKGVAKCLLNLCVLCVQCTYMNHLQGLLFCPIMMWWCWHLDCMCMSSASRQSASFPSSIISLGRKHYVTFHPGVHCVNGTLGDTLLG